MTLSSQYKIISREIKGIETVGVVIENDDGNTKNISMDDAIKLARSDKISNAHAILDTVNGKYILCVDCGIDKLENIDRTRGIKLSLVSRLISSDNKCIGYKAQDGKGKVYKLSIEKVWELAEQGSINNIEARINNNSKILVSAEEGYLANLPIINS